MERYVSLAPCYDALTYDVDYAGWADYLERHFARRGLPGKTILDLACGTGSLTWELARRGYELIGVDLSPEMLAQAAQKPSDGAAIAPMFLCQSMDKLDLYGTIDACVCCLDSVNYVTKPATLLRAFERVHLFMMPGGVFIFDVNSPVKLASLDGQVFLDETEDTYCVWRTEYSPRRRICTYFVDLFRSEGGLWRRSEELHEQFAYTPDELVSLLNEAGFRDVRLYGDRRMRAPRPDEDRIFFVARKD